MALVRRSRSWQSVTRPMAALSWPAGRTPGYNPNHPASSGMRASVIVSQEGVAGSAITPLNPFDANVWVKEATVTRGTFYIPVLGPTYSSNQNFGGFKYTGGTIETLTSVTSAAIVKVTGYSNFAAMANNSSPSTGGGFWFGVTSGATAAIQAVAATVRNSTFKVPLNVPFFICASANASTTNFAATNLLTGEIFSNTIGGGFTFTANDGQFGCLGPIGDHLNSGYQSTGMWSTAFLSLTQLQAWAATPWAFWYP